MEDKPTYIELEKRVKDLEEEVRKYKNTDAGLETLLKGTVRNEGKKFIENLVRDLCEALNVKYAMIGLLTGEKRDRVKILAMWSPDGYVRTFEYALEGTPCEKVLEEDDCLYLENVQEQFVEDEALMKMGIQSYFGSPLRDANGKVFGILSLMHHEKMEDEAFKRKMLDLFSNKVEIELEHKMTEKALRKSEERYRTFVDNAPMAMYTINTKGEFTYGNKKLLEMTGYKEEDWLLKPFHPIVYPDDLDFVMKKVQDRLSGKGTTEPYEARIYNASGSVMWVKITSESIYRTNENGDRTLIGMQSFVEDITEQKKMFEQLKEDRDREQMFLDIAEVLFLALDTDGKVTLINKKGCKILGYPEAKVLGRSWVDHFLPEEQRQDAESVFQQMMAGRVEAVEYVESPILTKNGERRYIDWHNKLLRNKTGEIIGIFSSGKDITQRKKAQEISSELQIQLQQAQKMEAIGTLAGGIAHDFNNILMPLLIHTEMTLEALPEDSPWIFNLEEVLKAGNRAKDLVRQILTFSRQSDEKKTHLKLKLIIKDCLKLLRSSLPSTIEIKLSFETRPGSDTVYADPTQIHQILMNLCTNAYHAMREKGGILEIRLANKTIDSNAEALFADLSPGTYHRLSVRDTGNGMEKQIMERIFDPYFTTKEKGEGTGLGLSVVHGIVKNHEGTINVESEPGKGATFHVFLPVAEIEEKMKIDSAVEITGGDERVLFVDDEKATTEVMKTMLERLGYSVKARTSSLEALELFRADPDGFDLIITDMTMPQMTGSELARAIMQIRQGIPVILCSGFSEQMNEERARKMGIRAFVMKPVIRNEISNIIRKVLDKKD